MRVFIALLPAFLTLGLLGSSNAAAAPAVKNIEVGEITRSGTSWARVVAQGNGYFKDEGLHLDTVVVQGGPSAVVQQVVSGALDIGVTNFDAVIRAIEVGAPLSIIGSSMIKTPFTLIAAAGIQKAADLKGKSICVAGPPKGPTASFVRQWLTTQGVKPAEVDLIYIGAAADRLAALQAGAVSAAVLTQPFDMLAMRRGSHRLADYGSINGAYGFLAFVAEKGWLAKNGDTAREFLRAVKRGSDWMHDPTNREASIRLLAMDIQQDPEIVREMYTYYFSELQPFSRDLSVPAPYLNGVLQSLVDSHDLQAPPPPASKYIDTQYLPH
jgi:ABC-type nitrate/sulfonate/bicarbonate transport system substrate-binding protein